MKLTIRTERVEDISKVNKLLIESFKDENTKLLTEMLRRRSDFIPELSIVAELNGTLVAYILLSPVFIQTMNASINTLWLEPVCVQVNYRNQGIAASIVREAFDVGRKLGFQSVFVTGPLDYYSRFGFQKACDFGIKSSIAIPSEVFLAVELQKNGLCQQGELIYPRDIFD